MLKNGAEWKYRKIYQFYAFLPDGCSMNFNLTHSNRFKVLSKICYKDAFGIAKPYFFKANIMNFKDDYCYFCTRGSKIRTYYICFSEFKFCYSFNWFLTAGGDKPPWNTLQVGELENTHWANRGWHPGWHYTGEICCMLVKSSFYCY